MNGAEGVASHSRWAGTTGGLWLCLMPGAAPGVFQFYCVWDLSLWLAGFLSSDGLRDRFSQGSLLAKTLSGSGERDGG